MLLCCIRLRFFYRLSHVEKLMEEILHKYCKSIVEVKMRNYPLVELPVNKLSATVSKMQSNVSSFVQHDWALHFPG